MRFLRHDGVEEARPMLRRDVRSIFAVMVASTLLSPAQAQADSVRALPRASFDGSRLHPYVNAWRYDVTLPDGSVHPQGVWTDQLLKTTRGGRDVFVRAQGTVFVNGTTSAVLNVFDPKTLMPISDEQTLKGGSSEALVRQRRNRGAPYRQCRRGREGDGHARGRSALRLLWWNVCAAARHRAAEGRLSRELLI